MPQRIHLYVDSMHSVGGVTTWAFQVAALPMQGYDARVVTVNRYPEDAVDLHLFPGQRIELPSGPRPTINTRDIGRNFRFSSSVAPRSPTIPTTPTVPSLPTPSTRPRKRTRGNGDAKPTLRTRRTKRTKATKPTLPTKPTLLGEECVTSWEGLDEFVRLQISETKLFIPNYLEVGFRHAALSRLQELPELSRSMLK